MLILLLFGPQRSPSRVTDTAIRFTNITVAIVLYHSHPAFLQYEKNTDLFLFRLTYTSFACRVLLFASRAMVFFALYPSSFGFHFKVGGKKNQI